MQLESVSIILNVSCVWMLDECSWSRVILNVLCVWIVAECSWSRSAFFWTFWMLGSLFCSIQTSGLLNGLSVWILAECSWSRSALFWTFCLSGCCLKAVGIVEVREGPPDCQAACVIKTWLLSCQKTHQHLFHKIMTVTLSENSSALVSYCHGCYRVRNNISTCSL